MGDVDLRPLLVRASRGDALVVAGVQCGDPAVRLKSVPLLIADGDDDTPLPQRLEAVLATDGWVRGESLAIRVEAARVARILVRGPPLEALGVESVADLERRFGPPEGVEHTSGCVVHHHPSRALAVAWRESAHRLDHIVLGSDPWLHPRYGGAELLTELVEHWAELERSAWQVPPEGATRVRYQRVAALARALDLGTVEDVAKGRFLVRRRESYAPLLREIASHCPRCEGKPRSAETVYLHLLHYRVEAEHVLCAAAASPESSDPAVLGMLATESAISAKLRDDLVTIDEWLAVFLDPRDRTFTERELIARWGWPDTDVHAH